MAPALPPQRILCIKLKHIGDVLLMTPAIRALRRAWPESAIAALVPRGTEDILEGNPDLNAVLVFDRGTGSWQVIRALHRFRPDLVLEMGQGDREAVLGRLSGARHRVGYAPGRSGGWRRVLLRQAVPWNGQQHIVETNLDLVRALGIPAQASRPVLVVRPEARSRMAARLAAAGLMPGRPMVVVHPVSRWLFKAWPEAGCAEVIGRLIRDTGVAVALTSGPGAAEVEAANRILARAGTPIINLIGQTTLGELAAVLERAALFLGVDSAPMHMAAALGVPVVALFGPSGEVSWGPWGEGHMVVTSPYLCRPCGQDGCLGSKRSDCLEAISAQAVMRAVEPVLSRVLGAPFPPHPPGERGSKVSPLPPVGHAP
ncbi:MAG: putative lipopolysaccharide heptosyltransferase III [candidate division NC10 bacterium RIFCSPLOWO2_12_FULL_66_18]|nr:MAG: putative lipopolysaccharide heptosyltransferase III [candidate division NC10 bacterium RIFCSPLOWO2_12_FULL_66_18]